MKSFIAEKRRPLTCAAAQLQHLSVTGLFLLDRKFVNRRGFKRIARI